MDRKLGYEIRKLNNLMHRKFMKEIKQSVGEDVTIIHAWILKYIIRMEPNDVFQKDIEREFEISKSTVTSTLKLMEKKGLITRESVDYDERLKKICITDIGKRIDYDMQEIAKRADSLMIEGIETERLNIFYEVLDEIKKNAEK